MKWNIIVPYRPHSCGCISSPPGEMHQLEDGGWKVLWEGKENMYGPDTRSGFIGESFKSQVDRGVYFLNKNSHYKHDISVVIDNEVYPNESFLTEYDNVKVIKAPLPPPLKGGHVPVWRMNWDLVYAISTIPDEDWICYGYSADNICEPGWDIPIVEAIKQFGGERFVYVPMVTEITASRRDENMVGVIPTPEQIWVDWRKYSQHILTMPAPTKDHVTEKDMINFANIARRGYHLLPQKSSIIIEKCHERIYGFYGYMVMKAKYAKKNLPLTGASPAYDILFDDNLWNVSGLYKAVIASSYLFHPDLYLRFENE